jgi:UDP-N-acetylmuramoylalanine--D-glutamate ligase
MKLTDKKVLVFGAGISGIGAAALLFRQGADVILYEGNADAKEDAIRAKLPEGVQAQIVIGALPAEVLEQLELVILSPGVPTDLPLVLEMKEHKIPVWGEVELAWACGAGDVLAVTGTNGKTTTTSLLGEILKAWKEEVYVVGNIGNPYTEAAEQMTEKAVTVAEISSFQLETIDTFAPKVSTILNITPDHLNRHHTMEEYIRVKELITKNQGPEDTCVLNYEDEILRSFGETLHTKVVYFSSLHTLEKGWYLEDGNIICADENGRTVLCATKELNLPGRHNHENVMAASAMAFAYGVPMEVIRKVVKEFKAVEHRIEYVTEKHGVVYYNDSKGTNPDAAIKGIEAMDRPTLLIGGGYDKNSSYEEWIRAFDGKVKYLVLIGQTREKIAEAAKRCGFYDIIMADSLEEAVQICADKAESGDAVLLSPACASWGMFPNYEVRGRLFKELVNQLA